MSVIGLDPSLTATGVATYHHAFVLGTKLRGPERMVVLRDALLDACQRHRATLVVVEAPSFSPRGRSVKEIGGIWWVLRVALHEAAIPTVEVPPSTLKKYATGKGNANKVEMTQAAWKRLDYDGTDDNIADAMWLRQIGLALQNEGEAVSLPQVNSGALAVLQDQWHQISKDF